MKGHALFQGEYIPNSENILTKFKNLLLQNQCANFNQTWHNLSFGEGNSNFTDEGHSLQGEIITK